MEPCCAHHSRTEAPREHTTVYQVCSPAHPGFGGGHDHPTGPHDRVYAPAAAQVTPHRMAIALLTSLSCHSTQTLADILRVFNALTDRLATSPFTTNSRSTPPTFTWHLFDLLLDTSCPRAGALARPCAAPLRRHPAPRREFVRGRGALQDTFPGRFTTVSPAAVEPCHDESLPRPPYVHLAPVRRRRQFLPAPGDRTAS